VVAGEQTRSSLVDAYNELRSQGAGYCVETAPQFERTLLANYSFRTLTDAREVIQHIGDPRSKVLSTSVGLHRLREVAPLIAEGLELRARDAASPILLLACENGRGFGGLFPSEVILQAIADRTPRISDLAKVVHAPKVVVDCVVPDLPANAADAIQIGDGVLWIEDTPLARLTLERAIRVKFSKNIDYLKTRKQYGYNTLHCLMSVVGNYIGESHVDRIARAPELEQTWREVVRSLIAAICNRHSVEAGAEIDGQSTDAYCWQAFQRLQQPIGNRFDQVSRALGKVSNGWYFQDGRLDGPIRDLQLLDEPWRSPAIAHALSLCVDFLVQSLDVRRGALPFLPPHRKTRGMLFPSPVVEAEACQNSVILSPQHDATPLMEVIAQDLLRLERADRTPWPASSVGKFLAVPIEQGTKVVPKAIADLKCAVFDLDEGLVATESLLFVVTHELISKYSRTGRTITHDEYASHVGESERGFFEQMIRTYNIMSRNADQLVHEREVQYLKKLKATNSEVLVKPGFRRILALLAKKSIKLAVCSNASKNRVKTTLMHVGLWQSFDFVACPDSGRAEKPSPEMLRAILTEFGAAQDHCLVIESSVIGVTAALNAGCFCILLVNDYTTPQRVARRGVEVLANSQSLLKWFVERFGDQ
jgi:HAD superfamily hydrolase (TIGR01509 family)